MNIQTEVQPATDAQRVVLSFFEALGDSDALTAVFTQDATWTVWGDSPLAGTYTGRDAVVSGFHSTAARLFSADHAGVLELIQLIGDGPIVAAEFTFRTMTALDRPYHNHYVEVFEIDGSQIKHVREYMDTQHLGKVCF